MPYSTLEQAKGSRDEDMLALAAEIVQRIAPAPVEPVPADYIARAARAERTVFRYLKDTGGGYVSGKSISGLSRSFNIDAGPVRRLVRDEMGSYATGGRLRTRQIARG